MVKIRLNSLGRQNLAITAKQEAEKAKTKAENDQLKLEITRL